MITSVAAVGTPPHQLFKSVQSELVPPVQVPLIQVPTYKRPDEFTSK